MCSKRLIIDTNILLLLVIGAVDNGRFIKRSKRLGAFDESDYQIAWDFVGEYDKVFITPYIAAEVSNLIDLHGQARKDAFDVARGLFAQFEQLNSVIMDDSKSVFFNDYGITDNSLINLVSEYVIFTNDGRLTTPLYAVCQDNVVDYKFIKEASVSR